MEANRRRPAEDMAALELRVKALEERPAASTWHEEPIAVRREKCLVERYGESVQKSVAAKMLGVTRATVYAMLADGRIRASCGGRRVDVRSIAAYLSLPAVLGAH